MAARLRCAIYTRKSSEEGLDQSFNSLRAQREACEAYIKSQAGEGWWGLPAVYDDGGFSGGSMDRPGLVKLLADIAARKIDIVVVYKVDRLTRSLADFARIIEAFDAGGVSFVSVTQAFNTTTSMGRLTLNVLLSFAQFEREVTGERIRDKIAASKAKGMWMGGNLPLGYDPPTDLTTRALMVNPAEAETVRLIFRRYLELGSVRELKTWLDTNDIRSKRWLSSRGRARGGERFSRGALFHLLNNRTYVGEIPHKDRSYPGAHPPIVEATLFDAVQARLGEQAQRRANGTVDRVPKRLKGLMFDGEGAPMSPTATRGTKGQVYRYYVSTQLITGTVSRRRDLVQRVPAPLIEDLVATTLAAASGREDMAPHEVLQRVEPHPSSLHLIADRHRLIGRPGDLEDDLAIIARRLPADHRILAEPGEDGLVRVIVPARLRLRRGRIVLTDAGGRVPQAASRPDRTLIRALRTAHSLLARLGDCPLARPEEAFIAQAPSNPYQRNLLKLAFLAPDLQAQILDGSQPIGLSLQRLIIADLPASWDEQRDWVESLR